MMGEEHWKVAEIVDAFEDWSATAHRRRRRPAKRLRLRATGTTLARCMRCGALAEWEYLPADGCGEYCDNCVPRGCDCRIIDRDRDIRGRLVSEAGPDGREYIWTVYDGPAPEQERDRFGRLLPCIEFEFYPGGFPRRPPDDRRETPAMRKARMAEIADTIAADAAAGISAMEAVEDGDDG